MTTTEPAARGGAPDDMVSLVLSQHALDDGGQVHLEAVVVDAGGDDGVESEDVAMLLMEGLADQVVVTACPGGPGGTTRLVWSGLQRGD